MSVLAKCYAAVVVGLLQEEWETLEWEELHVGAERGINCEHMQALLANILQRHWEWLLEDRRDVRVPLFSKYQTAFVASVDVKTALHVAQASRGVHDVILHSTSGGDE